MIYSVWLFIILLSSAVLCKASNQTKGNVSSMFAVYLINLVSKVIKVSKYEIVLHYLLPVLVLTVVIILAILVWCFVLRDLDEQPDKQVDHICSENLKKISDANKVDKPTEDMGTPTTPTATTIITSTTEPNTNDAKRADVRSMLYQILPDRLKTISNREPKSPKKKQSPNHQIIVSKNIRTSQSTNQSPQKSFMPKSIMIQKDSILSSTQASSSPGSSPLVKRQDTRVKRETRYSATMTSVLKESPTKSIGFNR